MLVDKKIEMLMQKLLLLDEDDPRIEELETEIAELEAELREIEADEDAEWDRGVSNSDFFDFDSWNRSVR